MNKQLFDELVGEPPPSSVDVDRIVAGKRRNATRRRLSAVAAATVAAGAVAVIGFGPLPDNGTGARAINQTGAKVSVTPSEVPPPKGVGGGKRTAESQVAAVDAAVLHAAPGARWLPAAGGDSRLRTFEFGESDGLAANTYRWPLQVAGRTGTLTIRIIFDGPVKKSVPAGTIAAWIPMPGGRTLSVESSVQPGDAREVDLLDQDQVNSIAGELAEDFRLG